MWRSWLMMVGLLGGLASAAEGPPTGPEPSRAAAPAPAASVAALGERKVVRVREPAVAGLFYPKDERVLGKTVEGLLAKVPTCVVTDLRALVCPHAGYPYSGETAAHAYRVLAGRDIETVILLAASHYALFQGVCLPDATVYRTPLGDVRISDRTDKLAGAPPFVRRPRAQVQRPGWSAQASRPVPPPGEETPETWEHSVEVQLPFLQKVLRDFTLLPLIFGEADPEQVARALAPLLDEKTLVVASTDLSHYHPDAQARELDKRCVQAICDLDLARMQTQEACGKLPVLTLMHLARLKGWQTKLLDYRNSGDVTGDKQGVVGYAAIAFYGESHASFTAADRARLLALARKGLEDAVRNGRAYQPDLAGLPSNYTERKGCFVTLTKKGTLRGCKGNIYPQLPLYEAIAENACQSALYDPRFEPVRVEELKDLSIEVSVLTEPHPLAFTSPEDLLRKLRPHRDGVVLQIGGRGATYLPQVWAQLPDKVAFLNSLAQKAGCEPSAWRGPGTSILIYEVESFQEGERH